MQSEPIRKTIWALALLLFLMPVLAGGNFPWGVDAQTGIFVWTIGMALLWAWTTLANSVDIKPLLKARLLWPLWLFILYLLISWPLAAVLDSAIRTSVVWLAVLLLPLTVLQLQPTRRETVVLVSALCVAAAVCGFYGVYQQVWGFDAMQNIRGMSQADLKLLDEVRRLQRPFSLFPGANAFGGFMLPFFPLSVWLLGRVRNWPGRVGVLILLHACIVGVYISYSRGAWVLLLVGMVAVAALYLPKTARRVLIAAGLVALIACYMLWNQAADTTLEATNAADSETDSGGRLASIFDPAEVSIQARAGYWETAWRMGHAYFPFGAGLGTFADVSRPHQSLPNYTRDPHNILLRLYAELGIFGVLLFVWALVSAGLAFYRGRSEGESTPHGLWMIALALLVAHAMIDLDFSSPAIVGVFWFLLSLFWRFAVSTASVASASSDPVKRSLVAVAVVLIVFGVQFPPLMSHNYLRLADAAAGSTQYGKALQLTESARAYWPLDPAVQYRLSRDYLRRFESHRDPADLKRAQEAVRNAALANPTNPEYHLGLADVEAAGGSNDHIVDHLRNAASSYPTSIHYRLVLAKGLSFSGDYAAALAAVDDALALEQTYLRHRHPDGMDLIEARFFRAAILNEQKRYEEAIAEYRTIIELCRTPGLVLQSYTSRRQVRIDVADVLKNAEDFIDRVRQERAAAENPAPKPEAMPEPARETE